MPMLKHLAHVIAVTVSLAASLPAAQAQSEPRTALIIGNANYSYARLENPTNDARDMADALRGAGFEVILKTDADQAGMKDGIRSFGSALKTKGGVGLLFFSGHGVQAGGENYLLPLGERPFSEAALKSGAVTAAEAVDSMAAARNALNIVILDACRDNPWLAGGAKGLSRVDSSSNLFVSFATSPGEVALDGTGRNSPYTKHLKGAIATANLTLEDTFKRTLKGVYQETSGKQQPWISSSFFGEFMFRPGSGAPAAVQQSNQQSAAVVVPRMVPNALAPGALPALGGIYIAEGTNPNGTTYRGMVALTPAGKQYRFTWWIGTKVYSGVGQFAGRMLVVDWGQRNPVIYSFGQSDNLEGEWADGSATERLVLFSRAANGAVTPPEGAYAVAGQNPNGTRYSGAVTISRQGNRYQFDWRVGQSAYRGTGTLDGNVLTVNWGSATPVVYSLSADGILRGLWSGGRGAEVLTPAR
jgi:hypothetical protein